MRLSYFNLTYTIKMWLSYKEINMITNYNGNNVSESIADIAKTFAEHSLYQNLNLSKKQIWQRAKRDFKRIKNLKNFARKNPLIDVIF